MQFNSNTLQYTSPGSAVVWISVIDTNEIPCIIRQFDLRALLRSGVNLFDDHIRQTDYRPVVLMFVKCQKDTIVGRLEIYHFYARQRTETKGSKIMRYLYFAAILQFTCTYVCCNGYQSRKIFIIIVLTTDCLS